MPFVGVCINGKGPYWFVLDTGASTSVVTTQLAAALDLAPVGSAPAPVAIGCVLADSRVAIRNWSLGSIPLSPQDVLSAEIPGFGLGSAPAGVLGGDVLGRFGAIRIDYRASKLSVLAPEGPAPAHATYLSATPSLEPPPPLLVHGTARAEAFLTVLRTPTSALSSISTVFGNRTPYQFVVDTGSALSTVSSPAAGALQLTKTATTTTGSPNVGCQGTFDEVGSGSWSIAGVRLAHASLALVTLAGSKNAPSGTIGSDVLSHYGSVVVDYRTGILWLGVG